MNRITALAIITTLGAILLAGCAAPEISSTTTAYSEDASETTSPAAEAEGGVPGTTAANAVPISYDYGVFLSVTDSINFLSDYKTVVIDAQYFTKAEIDAFRTAGHKVYSYINVGSLETFRDYYSGFKDLALGDYEHWDEESWIDVSDSRWQTFLIGSLIPSLLAKNIDGFFVDNCDVYYNYPTKQILDGLTVIMQTMVNTGKAVIINSGDTFMDAYCEGGGQWCDVITGINQESVFSRILWDGDRFGTALPEDREYFQDYIERYAAKGADIFLLEYTHDEQLIREICEYCQKNGFSYYISDSVELDR